jgi:Rab3 GTPase-activating protein catalytic subunit
VSQPSAALTADQLEAEAELLLRLGDDAAAEALRRERAEAALQSDMSAFKAANPGAVLEDFVRWHSPKDWRSRAGDGDGGVPTAAAAQQASSSSSTRRDRRRGELSLRMRQKNNRWQKLWTVSRRRRQSGRQRRQPSSA